MALERDDILFLADRYPVEGMDQIGFMKGGASSATPSSLP
jgi:hypothetical protein